jgi:AmmeMemoRadiSam system protein B
MLLYDLSVSIKSKVEARYGKKVRVGFLYLVLFLVLFSGHTSQIPYDREKPKTSVVSVQAEMRSGQIHRPKNEGMLYPIYADELATMLDGFLSPVEHFGERPIALIVPHGSYAISGQIAAYGFRQLEPYDYEVAVVIATDHFPPLAMPIAVWTKGVWQTPLGQIAVDEQLAEALVEADMRISADEEAFAEEHPIVAEIPFIQRTCPQCEIVPVIMGNQYNADVDALTNALVELLPGRRAIVIASSDLSHFPSYTAAREIDALTLQAIVSLDPKSVRATVLKQMALEIPSLTTCACGEGAILVTVQVARELGANKASILAYTNSGERPGGRRDLVTGFATVMFYRNE